MHALGPSPTRNEALPGWKRSLDIVLCLIALPVMAAAACWSALITWFASPGPIFFKQERVGLKGRRFFLLKFRTMHVSSTVVSHQAHFTKLMKSNVPMQKLDDRGDKRVIFGGRLLRATGLDELPQIINVLRGEMSIVGPRPGLPYECEHYTPEQRRRLDSMPGLTGLWQVSGKNRTTFEEMIRLDLAYGERRSFLGDVKIIFLTPFTLGMQVFNLARPLAGKKAEAKDAVAPATEPVTTATVAAIEKVTNEALSTTYAAKSQNVLVGATAERPTYLAQPVSDAFVTSTNMESHPGRFPRQTDRTSSAA